MKLQLKILFPILLLIILMAGTIGYVSYQKSADELRGALVDNMRGQAEALARAVNTMTRNALTDIARVAGRADIRELLRNSRNDAGSAKIFSAELKSIEESYPDFDLITILDSRGTVAASSDAGTIGRDFSNREYFREAMGGKTFFTPPFKSPVTSKGTMVAAAPVMVDNKAVGVVFCTILLDHLYEVSVAPVSVGTRGYAFILGPDGLIAVHKNTDWIFNSTLSSIPHYKEMAVSTASGIKEFIGNLGTRVFNYHAKDAFSGLTTVIQAESDDVFSGLAALRRNTIIVAAISIVLAGLLVLLALRPVLSAINAGARFAGQVAAGDLSGTLNINRKDELGQLAGALRSIPESLKQIIAEYQTLEKSIESGQLDAEGDQTRFSGDFASLIRGTNVVLARFRTIIDNIPSPVMTIGKDLKLRYMNAVAQQMTTSDYKGKTGEELFCPEDMNSPENGLKRALATNRASTAETRAHVGGKALDISYTAIPMHDASGGITCLLQLVIDLSHVKETQRIIMDVVNNAMSISNSVAAASEQLAANVKQVNAGTEGQRSRVSSTVTAMEEMNVTVLEVARNSGQANEQADETRAKADKGSALVQQVVSAVREVNVVAEELQGNMKDLGAQAEAIGGVMNVISDIADQTNLLALNAAIEAARAGEAGRGFAVVADEVRKLAEKTMSATTEVGGSIRGIQNATTNNIRRVLEVGKSITEATHLAATSGEALQEIVLLAGKSSALIASIATAAEEQSATSEEINRSLEEINSIAEKTSSDMRESASSVQSLSQLALELKELLNKLRS